MRKIFSVLSKCCRAAVAVLPIVAVLALTTCDENNEVEIPATLDIPEESLQFFEYGINFEAASQSGDVLTVKLSFTSSLSWSISIENAKDGSSITWLKVNPTSGSAGPNEITVSAQDNSSEQPRSAKITITCGSISKTINVTQAGLEKSNQEGGLTVNPAEVKLVKQEKIQLKALDADGNQVSATWSSSNEKIASVDPSGQVEARNPGEAIITAQADGKTGTCKVTVEDEIAVQSLTFDKTELSLNVGETYTLTPIFTPDNATNKTIYKWVSTVPAVAKVDDNGMVTAVAAGKTSIRAGLDSKGTIMAECVVTVTDPDAVTVESVVLDITEATIIIDQEEPLILTATVTPEKALDKLSIEWKSSNPKTVVVESINKTQAKVTGLAAGKETVTANIGGKSATCQITVNEPEIEEVVDMGLSVKWRAWNLGATKPIEYGDYYAWGETEPYYTSLSYSLSWGLDPDGWKEGKSEGYRWQSYKYRTSGFYAWQDGTDHLIVSKYNTQEGNGPVDNKTVLDPEDDAAHVILGGDWRMPTLEEWQELLDNCTTEYIKMYDYVYKNGSNPGFGASAMKFTSKINGNSIILPLSGHFFTDYISIYNSYYGYYWSSSLVESYIEEEKQWAPGQAWACIIVEKEVKLGRDTRSNGLPIRPVTK